MTGFYRGQSVLMLAMFLSLLLAVFLEFFFYGEQRGRLRRFMDTLLFLLLFGLLAALADDFVWCCKGLSPRGLSPVPVWTLWAFTCGTDLWLACESTALWRRKSRRPGRNAVKQAMDTLPRAICYFTPSGRVKLCNLQMHRLYRQLAQSDLQSLDELQQALADCDERSNIIRLSDARQTYMFPDGRVWQYRKSDVAASDGTVYAEAVFSDVSELYEKHQEIKMQTRQLEKISAGLKELSENVLTLTKEQEVLNAKTRLHDQMGAGLIAIRQILQQDLPPDEADAAVELFQKAVEAIKNDTAYPLKRGQLAEFLQDAAAIGVRVEMRGEPRLQGELHEVFLLAMRECLTNSVRHADAGRLMITLWEDAVAVSMRIKNDGAPPGGEITPKGGLLNLSRHVADCGGAMEIQWEPDFALTVIIPAAKEDLL